MASKPLRPILVKVLPISFALGAAMEYFMITVKIGEETFYDTAKRLEAARRRDRAESRSELKDKVFRQIESGKSVFEDIKL